MAVPKWKMSRSRTRRRRAHDGLKDPTVSRCPQCKEPVLRHHVCLSCGSYRGRQVFTVDFADNE